MAGRALRLPATRVALWALRQAPALRWWDAQCRRARAQGEASRAQAELCSRSGCVVVCASSASPHPPAWPPACTSRRPLLQRQRRQRGGRGRRFAPHRHAGAGQGLGALGLGLAPSCMYRVQRVHCACCRSTNSVLAVVVAQPRSTAARRRCRRTSTAQLLRSITTSSSASLLTPSPPPPPRAAPRLLPLSRTFGTAGTGGG